MAVDDVSALTSVQLGPPHTVESPRAGIQFGNQLGDRPRLAGVGIEPRVVDLQEYPLGPLVEVRVGGREAAPRVVTEPEPPQLPTEVHDVRLGPGTRVCSGLNGVLLGGEAEGVKPQGVQHVATTHAEVPRVDIGSDVTQRMTYMQALTRRIGEHVLDEHLVRRNRAVGRCQ